MERGRQLAEEFGEEDQSPPGFHQGGRGQCQGRCEKGDDCPHHWEEAKEEQDGVLSGLGGG